MKLSFLSLLFLPAAEAFTNPVNNNRAFIHSNVRAETSPGILSSLQDQGENGKPLSVVPTEDSKGFNPLPAANVALCLLSSEVANAAGPDWGIFEGKTGSLLHPVMMFGMLTLSVSTALLGFEWRRQRTIGDEISALKKTLPKFDGASSVSEALKACKAEEEVDSAQLSRLQAALPIDAQIKDLQTERKTLAAKGPKDKHYGQGAMLAFLGTVFAIEGPLNTYARAGKLFPGPHLYAGAGLVCLWALAVACVPQMQKGNDVARTVHIGANIGGIGMFLWQLQSGIPILLKVWEKTNWP
mmetsp:Transcript_30038/g.64364  ORF Transcript_30038/g.64364 Transcript_30038/m.64364 type:complete len:298 (+) Transcript_30038:77-970(+)|eukprot:CAMPEP_0201209080 /NCGR_PEP_ID=MMETSP0851-20130426/177580_1 /ASSEMBLY_ACC=CAM_ASM_000631 /TAXON_ID=183588 /ORGANISM="Pseudo-nitzschia fraudulenta, Strain WWA7" /LENGTH=297 /DNA_ID=CAMNT_0047497707 /DNA_START=136 /DNA_END=1029 /DNA_ORIENTATION=+